VKDTLGNVTLEFTDPVIGLIEPDPPPASKETVQQVRHCA
jgi:hypothetical protein